MFCGDDLMTQWEAPTDNLRLDEDLRRRIREIRSMDHEVGEFVLTSGGISTLADHVIDSEIHSYGRDVPREAYGLMGLFTLPWNAQEVCGLDSFLTGRDTEAPEGMSGLLEWVNTSPYDQFVTAAVFLSDLDDFEEIDRMTAWMLFRALLFDTGLRNIGSCDIYGRVFGEYDMQSGRDDHNAFIREVVEAVHGSYKDAVEICRGMDISKELDGNELSFVRHSRTYKGTFTVQDASTWTNGLEDQAVRGKLSRLTELGILTKEGRTRGTRFRYNDPFEDERKVAEDLFNQECGDFSFTEGK